MARKWKAFEIEKYLKNILILKFHSFENSHYIIPIIENFHSSSKIINAQEKNKNVWANFIISQYLYNVNMSTTARSFSLVFRQLLLQWLPKNQSEHCRLWCSIPCLHFIYKKMNWKFNGMQIFKNFWKCLNLLIAKTSDESLL